MQSVQVLKTAFDEYLKHAPLRKDPESLYSPVSYVLSQPGKRIRPVMLLLAYYLFREDYKKALPAALALEYFHNFTLVHDDIMDAAQLRRGRKTVHAQFSTNAAILSGDLMLIRSFDLLLAACDTHHVHRVLGEFSDVASQICEGQQFDMDFEARDNVKVDEYLTMIEQKTSVLLGCALHIGALLADAPVDDAERLNDIGINLGKAFQIQDDVLDAYGEEARVGKKRGGDILQKKKSILYALAWESATQVGRTSLADLYNKEGGNPEVKIQQVLNVFDKHDVRARAEHFGDMFFNRALESVDSLSIAGDKLLLLRDFIQAMHDRDF